MKIVCISAHLILLEMCTGMLKYQSCHIMYSIFIAKFIAFYSENKQHFFNRMQNHTYCIYNVSIQHIEFFKRILQTFFILLHLKQYIFNYYLSIHPHAKKSKYTSKALNYFNLYIFTHTSSPFLTFWHLIC